MFYWLCELLILYNTYKVINSLNNNNKNNKRKTTKRAFRLFGKSFSYIAPEIYFLWGSCQNHCWANFTWFAYLIFFFTFWCGKLLINTRKIFYQLVIAGNRRSSTFLIKLLLCSRHWYKLRLKLFLVNLNYFSWTTCQ